MTDEPGSTAFLCPNCDRPAKAYVRGEAVWDGHDATRNFVAPPSQHQLLQCDECDGVVLVWREDYGEGFAADEPLVVFPAPRRLNVDIPRDLRADWDEAMTCFNAKAYQASAVMVRRTIEGACTAQGATKGSLSEKIKKLEGDGTIGSTLAEWAHLLRVVGNEGAHAGKKIAREDAEDALAFAEALLDHIYVLRKRFDEFKARRGKTATKAPAT